MVTKEWKKRRKILFPEIKDWSDPQDHIRKLYRKGDLKKLTYFEWLWLHPSAYKLFHYGINPLGVCSFGFGTGFFIFKKIYILSVILGIMLIINCFQFYKKLKEGKLIGDMTLYDLYLRDYDYLENED